MHFLLSAKILYNDPMKTVAWFFLVVSLFAGVALGDGVFVLPEARLAVAAQQDPAHYPFRTATLTLKHPPTTPHEVSLHWNLGGPAMRYPLPPGLSVDTPIELTVMLPAMALTQVYDISLHPAHQAKPTPLTPATITWPLDLLTTDTFLDADAYEPYETALPTWPGSLKRNLSLAAALFVVLLGGCLFLRHPAIRLLAILLTTALATGGACLLLQNVPAVEVISAQNEFLLTCRRTSEISLAHPPKTLAAQPLITPRVYPVYLAAWQLREENLTYHPITGPQLTLHPADLRLFRPQGEQRETATPTANTPTP
jgi:hypothetical protein